MTRDDSYGDGIPAWHEFMVFTLQALEDGATLHRKDLENRIIKVAGITSAQLAIEFQSGEKKVLNRMGWGLSALTRAGALAKPSRGFYQVTNVGRELLKTHSSGITEKHLMSLEAWNQYVPQSKKKELAASPLNLEVNDPTELIELGVARVNAEVSIELLSRLRLSDPIFFEKAVVTLLLAMGYGGTERRVKHLGQSNDGGVDGVIDQDALGLNRVFVQAKRYAEGNTVQRPDLQKFVGALADKGATQGVFVTTSAFSSGALEYVERIPNRVVLIDGNRFADLMIRYKVGVQIKQSYELVELDEDFFE